MVFRKYYALIVVVVIFGALLFSFNIQRYFAPLSSFEDPLQQDNDYFSIGKYPSGYNGACMFTVDDVSFWTLTEELQSLREITRLHGAHATYFVIPMHGGAAYPISNNKEVVELLLKCMGEGDEVALHGYTHTPTAELKGKSRTDQEEIIRKGLAELTNIFGPVYGFRPPAFWKNTATYSVLEELEFLYCASACVFNVNPYHPLDTFSPFFGEEINLIEIPCFPTDYLANITSENSSEQLFKLKTRFDGCYEKGAPFVFFSHLETLLYVDKSSGRYEGLSALDKFLNYTHSLNIWMPTMLEYAKWQIFLEDIKISYNVSSNKINISMMSDDVIDGITIYMNLPDDINDVTISFNNVVCYKCDTCSKNEIIIL
ncbi:MAG: DUF2334 domain-containing protein [Candidatus Methanofastidiosia archaeon]